jgi:hypothetical protein
MTQMKNCNNCAYQNWQDTDTFFCGNAQIEDSVTAFAPGTQIENCEGWLERLPEDE